MKRSRVDFFLISRAPLDEPHEVPIGVLPVSGLRVVLRRRFAGGWKPKTRNRGLALHQRGWRLWQRSFRRQLRARRERQSTDTQHHTEPQPWLFAASHTFLHSREAFPLAWLGCVQPVRMFGFTERKK